MKILLAGDSILDNEAYCADRTKCVRAELFNALPKMDRHVEMVAWDGATTGNLMSQIESVEGMPRFDVGVISAGGNDGIELLTTYDPSTPWPEAMQVFEAHRSVMEARLIAAAKAMREHCDTILMVIPYEPADGPLADPAVRFLHSAWVHGIERAGRTAHATIDLRPLMLPGQIVNAIEPNDSGSYVITSAIIHALFRIND